MSTLYRFYDSEWPHDNVQEMSSQRWNREIYIDSIAFEPGHVVFKAGGSVVLALRNARVDDLMPAPEKPTFMKERVTREAIRQCGVMSPAAHHAFRTACTFSEHGPERAHSWQMGATDA